MTTPLPLERRTLTVEEAGQLLGLGRTLSYELARRGELPGVLRLGRRLVVSRAALEQALANGTPSPTAPHPAGGRGGSA